MRAANQCDNCGKFVRYADLFSYTEFGSSVAQEPPDPVFVCRGCVENAGRPTWMSDPKQVWQPLQPVTPQEGDK